MGCRESPQDASRAGTSREQPGKTGSASLRRFPCARSLFIPIFPDFSRFFPVYNRPPPAGSPTSAPAVKKGRDGFPWQQRPKSGLRSLSPLPAGSVPIPGFPSPREGRCCPIPSPRDTDPGLILFGAFPASFLLLLHPRAPSPGALCPLGVP